MVFTGPLQGYLITWAKGLEALNPSIAPPLKKNVYNGPLFELQAAG
jgi:hypothetical protein